MLCHNLLAFHVGNSGFESGRLMFFNSNGSTNSYRSLASHQRQPNRLPKVQMNTFVTPMESPDEIPEKEDRKMCCIVLTHTFFHGIRSMDA